MIVHDLQAHQDSRIWASRNMSISRGAVRPRSRGGVDSVTDTHVAVAAPRRFAPDTQSDALGLSLWLCPRPWGIIVLRVRAGRNYRRADPGDLILMRFSVSGLVLLPFLVRWGLPSLAGIGWRRGLILTLLGGPGFGLMQMGGYAFAPLAHGAVMHPASVTILSTGIAAALLKERLGSAHLCGAALVIAGIVLISWQGLHAGDRCEQLDRRSVVFHFGDHLGRFHRSPSSLAAACHSRDRCGFVPLAPGGPSRLSRLVRVGAFARPSTWSDGDTGAGAGTWPGRPGNDRLQPGNSGSGCQPGRVISSNGAGPVHRHRHSGRR